MIRLQVAEHVKDLLSSYWFVPLLCSLAAIVFVLLAAWLDMLAGAGQIPALVFFEETSPAGRRALLSTIAASSIAVAGTVFSISMVVLSTASAQLGPRLLPNFFKRNSTQLVLGGFIATFLAALLVLAQVTDSVGEPNTHSYGIGLSFALAVLSLALLVYFLQSVSLFIQAPLVIDDVATDLMRVLVQQTEPSESAEKVDSTEQEAAFAKKFEGECGRIEALRDGYIQAVDANRGCEIAAGHDVTIKFLRRPGHFVAADDTLVLVVPGDRLGEDVIEKIREVIVIGAQRTNSQDVEYVIDQLVEIAIRALSPGINDPITAINCIDRLGGALGILRWRQFHSHVYRDDSGNARLLMEGLSDRTVLDMAFNQLRQHASDNVAVSLRLMEMIASLGMRVTRESFKKVLLEQLKKLHAACQREISGESDLRDIEDRYRRAMEALSEPGVAARQAIQTDSIDVD